MIEESYLDVKKVTLWEMPEYICPKHGDIGTQTLNSTIPGHEAVLCLRCYIEKLKELGVTEVKEKL